MSSKCSDATLPQRLWSKVSVGESNECWEWRGASYSFGYGCIGTSKGLDGAHRVSYRLTFGQIPDGMCVLHRCDNPKCVNPEHLFAGTKKDNAIDREKKNRGGRIAPRGEKSGTAKLTADQVREIRASSESLTKLASRFGIGPSQVLRIKQRLRWGHI